MAALPRTLTNNNNNIVKDAFEAERPPGGSGPGGGNASLSLSWNQSRFDPPAMVVGGNTVKVCTEKWEGPAYYLPVAFLCGAFIPLCK